MTMGVFAWFDPRQMALFYIRSKTGHLAGVKTGQKALLTTLDLKYAYSKSQNNLSTLRRRRELSRSLPIPPSFLF
jgi:hypothetical protein